MLSSSLSYALLAVCVAVFVFSLWAGGKQEPAWVRPFSRYSFVLQIAAFAAAYAILRPGSGSDGPSDVRAAAANNQPIFIDIYSNF